MRFSYTAITKDGKTVTGVSDAVSKEALISTLTRQGSRPIVVKADRAAEGILAKFKKSKKVKLRELVVFTRQLSTMISAGVPLNRSLATLQSQAESKYFREVIAGIAKDVEGGMTLGDAFAK